MVSEIQHGQLAALEHAPINLLGFFNLKGAMNLGPKLLQPEKLLAHKLHVLVGGSASSKKMHHGLQ